MKTIWSSFGKELVDWATKPAQLYKNRLTSPSLAESTTLGSICTGNPGINRKMYGNPVVVHVQSELPLDTFELEGEQIIWRIL